MADSAPTQAQAATLLSPSPPSDIPSGPIESMFSNLQKAAAGESGAQEISLVTIIKRVRSRNWFQTLRPLASFASLSKFSRPRNTTEASTRLELNTTYFLTNYVLVSVLIFIYAILSRPFLLLVGGALGAMWYYVLKTPELRLSPTIVLKGKQKITLAAITSGMSVLLFAGTTIFMVLGVSATVVLLHALLHAAPTAAEEAEAEAIDAASTTELSNV